MRIAGLVATVFLIGACAHAPEKDSARARDRQDALNRARVHTELGAAYYGTGQYKVALEELQIALQADPGYVPAINQFGLVHLALGQDKQAQTYLERALKLDPDDPSVNNNYGMFLCQRGRDEEAMRYFTNALRNPLYQTPEVAYVNAGVCAKSRRETIRAEGFFRKALALSADQPQALFHLAEIAYEKDDFVAARAFITRHLQVAIPRADALWLAARVESRIGDKNALATYGAQLNRRFPDAPQTRAFNQGDFR